MSIGERLKIIREKMSQRDFGIKFGAAPNTIRKYENNEASPNTDFILAICDSYNINLLWLMTGEGTKEKDANRLPTKEFQNIDWALLQDIIIGIEKYLIKIDGYISPEKKAQLVKVLYDIFNEKEEKKIKPEIIFDMVKLTV